MVCRHCQRNKAVRPRGLCEACFMRLDVREMYAVADHPCNYRGEGIGCIAHREPAPTDTLSGTPEREAVLTERVAKGESTTSKRDARRSLE